MSNLMIRSNLMLESRKPAYRYIPGDYVIQIYEGWINELTEVQSIENEQYLVCTICKKTCAGTCSK